MYIKGKVTKIDLKFCNFELDNEIQVLGGYYVAFSKKFSFPSLNSYVVLSNFVYNSGTIILTKNSVINCTKFCWVSQKFRSDPFISLIKQSNISLLDCIVFLKRIDFISENQVFNSFFLRNIKWNETFNFKEVIVKVLPFVEQICCDIFDYSSFKIWTPFDFMFKEKINKIDASKFSYGVNSVKNNNFIFGYLKVSARTSYISILDAKYALKCQIYCQNSSEYTEKLSKLLNNFVIIKNYRIFYEYSKNSGIFDYIFVDISNIHVIHARQITNVEINIPQKFEITIKLVNKGIVCVKDEKIEEKNIKVIKTEFGVKKKEEIISKTCQTNQCWLQSEVTYDNNNLGTNLLVLHGKNFEKYPLFNCGDIYTVQTNCVNFMKLLRRKICPILYNLDTKPKLKIPVIKIPEDAIFNFITNEPQTLVQFGEVRDLFGVENKNILVSFEGVISKRVSGTFLNYPPPKNNNCGIRGGVGQHLTIQTVQHLQCDRPEQVFYRHNLEEGEKIYQENLGRVIQTKKIESTTIYLEKWNEILTPLGIIDNMRVAFRNGLNPLKKDYLRTCFITTIEPLEYCCKQEFNTTQEILGNYDWGPSVSLSNSSHIPTGCLCWGEALNLSFKALNIKIKCSECDSMYFTSCCGAPKLNLLLGFWGTDSRGRFDAVSREDSVLQQVLNLKEMELKLLKLVFFVLKDWAPKLKEDYYVQNETVEEEDLNITNNCIYDKNCEILRYMILFFNKITFCEMQIKARKLTKDDKSVFKMYEKWYPVEARFINNSNIFETLYFLK